MDKQFEINPNQDLGITPVDIDNDHDGDHKEIYH